MDKVIWEDHNVKVIDEDALFLKLWQKGDSVLVDSVSIQKRQFSELAIYWLTEHAGYDVVKRETEIAPCPFCGGECNTCTVKIRISNSWWMTCERCSYTSAIYTSEEEVIYFHNQVAKRKGELK